MRLLPIIATALLLGTAGTALGQFAIPVDAGLVPAAAPPFATRLIAQSPSFAVSPPVAPVPLLAQAPQPQAAPPAAPADGAAAEGTAQPDLTALRYFARQGDTRRVNAEIARLKALFPGWEPPENLLAEDTAPDPDIERMWQLFADGDFAGARAAIAQKQASEPGFAPAPDLLRALELGETAARLRNASEAKQYQTVLSIAANTPDLLTCEYVDLMWRLAEAFIATDAKQRGTDVYTYLLTNCSNPPERFATLQQAMTTLDRAELTPLLALERKDEAGVGEFAPMRLDLARSAIASIVTGKAGKVEPGDLALVQTHADDTRNADDWRLLGWYFVNQNKLETAREQFQKAMDADPSAISANGLAVALLRLDDPAPAEAVLAEYRDESEDMKALYLTAAGSLLAVQPRLELEAEVLERIVAEAVAEKSAPTAQEMGWYAYDFNQPQTAREWFELSLGWDETLEASAYGIVVSSDRLQDQARVQQMKAAWGARSQRIAEFGLASTAGMAAGTVAPTPAPAPNRNSSAQVVVQQQPYQQAPVQVVQQSQPTQQIVQPGVQNAVIVEEVVQQGGASRSANGGRSTTRGCANYMPAGTLSPQQALTRAWCLMELNRTTEAAAAFERALQSTSEATRTDAAYGQSLAYLRLGLADDAAVSAAAAPQSDDRVFELQSAILAQTATRAYDTGDYRRALGALDERSLYAPEQNDLLTLRAWSYFHLGRLNEAERIFAAVAATGYREAAEGLKTVKQTRAAEQQPQF